jgi:hypothetical protein
MSRSSRQPVPTLDGYGLMRMEINSPSTILEFLGDERILTSLPRAADYNTWTFAFFGVSVSDIDFSYGSASDVSSFAVTPFSDVDRNFNFSVELVLKSGGLKLKCYDYYFFGRKAIERPL